MLVGWSYGGTIVAGAADLAPERIGHLVYFDSDVPRDGDTSAPRSAHARRLELAQQYGDGCASHPRRHAWNLPCCVSCRRTNRTGYESGSPRTR